jgi:hypothetical protein
MPRAEIVRNPSQAGKIVPLNLVEAVHYLAEEENSSPGDSSANCHGSPQWRHPRPA